MHWADKISEEIIKSEKYKPYWVDDMKTPSGRVHIGSVRAVVTHDLIYKSLLHAGVKATFSYVLEDHDPMDGLPIYLDQEEYKKHLGKPLFRIPSPDPGYESFGRRWGQEYIDIFESLDTHPKIYWGSELYLSGKMNQVVELCLNSADKIKLIYKKLYKKVLPDDWYPFQITCEKCGKISTTRVTNWNGKEVTYTCNIEGLDWTKGCGHTGKISPFNGNGKLPWKVEWPCKWKVIGVTVEGAGKDHMTAGGSHDFAKLMCKDVLGYPLPYAFSHEFFLVGGRKMSSSKGLGSSAKEVSEIIPPYLVRFMIARIKYSRAINFDPNGMTIPDLFDRYDKVWKAYIKGTNKTQARIFESSYIGKLPPRKEIFLARFRDVANYLQQPNVDLLKKFEEIKGARLTKQEQEILKERTKYAKIWLERYAPNDFVYSVKETAGEELGSLSQDQKSYLKELINLIEEAKDPNELEKLMYELSKKLGISPKKAFQGVYIVLIGKKYGPKAAWLIFKDKDKVIERFKKL